jgi:hypothetical protein
MNLRWIPPFFLFALIWSASGVWVQERYGLALGTVFIVSLFAGATAAIALQSWFKRRSR